jgi:aryl-alcohol dehydrogenase-like predicted oxidoreductase
LGASVYEVDEFETSLLDDRIEVIQVPLNPLDRRFSNVLVEASTGGRSMVIRSVFLQGSLLMNPSRLPRRIKHLAPFVADFQAIANRFEVSPAGLVFAWLRSVGQPDGVVVGVDSLQDLEEISKAVREPCDSDAVEMVSEMKVPSWPEVDPRRWV